MKTAQLFVLTRPRLALFFAVLLCGAALDQGAKFMARVLLEGAPEIVLAAGMVRFELVANPGGFLSMGAQLPEFWRAAFFVAAVPLLLLALCAAMLRAGLSARRELAALALVVGGGLGNWLDRLYQNGAVTDFVSVGIGPLRTGIFNLADVFILAGSALLLWSTWRAPRGKNGETSGATSGEIAGEFR